MKRLFLVCLVLVTAFVAGNALAQTQVQQQANQSTTAAAQAGNNFNINNPNMQTSSDALAVGLGGDASSHPTNIVDVTGHTLNIEAQDPRVPPGYLPYITPPFPYGAARGPQMFGPKKDGGIEVIQWNKEDMWLINNVKKGLSPGLLGFFGDLLEGLFNSKDPLRAKGFYYSNTIPWLEKRPVENRKPKVLIVINYGVRNIPDEMLWNAGYIFVGNLSIDPPPRYNGVVVDDQFLKGMYMNSLYHSRVDLAVYYYDIQPVSESKAGYFPGITATTNDKNFGLAVGGGNLDVKSEVSTRYPSCIRGFVYDPARAAKKKEIVMNIVQSIMTPDPNKPLPTSPSALIGEIGEEVVVPVPTGNGQKLLQREKEITPVIKQQSKEAEERNKRLLELSNTTLHQQEFSRIATIGRGTAF